jgi:hypothetical protein
LQVKYLDFFFVKMNEFNIQFRQKFNFQIKLLANGNVADLEAQ